MDSKPRRDLDAWADALLDQHRTVPRGEASRLNEPAPLEDLPPMVRLSMKFGGAHPTREQMERINKAAARNAAFAKWEAIFTTVGVVMLMAFVFAALSGF